MFGVQKELSRNRNDLVDESGRQENRALNFKGVSPRVKSPGGAGGASSDSQNLLSLKPPPALDRLSSNQKRTQNRTCVENFVENMNAETKAKNRKLYRV